MRLCWLLYFRSLLSVNLSGDHMIRGESLTSRMGGDEGQMRSRDVNRGGRNIEGEI
jgi:hypothetical protein